MAEILQQLSHACMGSAHIPRDDAGESASRQEISCRDGLLAVRNICTLFELMPKKSMRTLIGRCTTHLPCMREDHHLDFRLGLQAFKSVDEPFHHLD